MFKTTLGRQLNSGQSIRQFNASKRWFSAADDEVMVENIRRMSQRMVPVNYPHLLEMENDILSSKLPQGVQPQIVGHNWAPRFLARHHDCIGIYTSSRIDSKRGRALACPSTLTQLRIYAANKTFALRTTPTSSFKPACVGQKEGREFPARRASSKKTTHAASRRHTGGNDTVPSSIEEVDDVHAGAEEVGMAGEPDDEACDFD